ncbi:MAG: prenyltransferase/squalene oxidase repeat-containing protein [Planctomycetota bacterium]
MLQVARLAPRALGEATPRVLEFLHDQLTDEGGAQDRAGKADLYYTAFLLDALVALSAELPVAKVRPFLASFGDGEHLDLVHRACLVRCWAALGVGWPSVTFGPKMLAHLAACRTPDGSYGMEPGRERGTLYDAFLSLGAHQDLLAPVPEPARLVASMHALRTPDGGFSNESELRWGMTPSTAAAVAVLVWLGAPPPDDVGRWLLSQIHPKGGFKAIPDAPMPDLLSTATSLHALALLGVDIGAGRELCLDFLDSLWSGRSFYGHWADDELDSEYTFYALLALGHLA